MSWEALVELKLLIYFKSVFLSMQEKLKLEAWWNECDIDIILEWFLYFNCLQSCALNVLMKTFLYFIPKNFTVFNNIREKVIEVFTTKKPFAFLCHLNVKIITENKNLGKL